MDREKFLALLRDTYFKLLQQDRHTCKCVHLKALFQAMKLQCSSLRLAEFKSQLADLHSSDFLIYQMDRGSIIDPATKVYGIACKNGTLAYLKLNKPRKETTG